MDTADTFAKQFASTAAKEVHSYAQALRNGFETVTGNSRIYTYPKNMYRKVSFSIYMMYIVYRKLVFSEHLAGIPAQLGNELLFNK